MSSITSGFGSSDQRGASAIVGLVLLFGMVMVGAGLILMASMSATESVKQESELNNAELSLQEASIRLRSLSFQDQDDVASFDLGGRDADDVRIERNGNLTFELNSNANCRASMPLGSIIYRNDNGQSVAYQAGGVWRESESGTTIVSSPDLTYRIRTIDNQTIRTFDFPVVNVEGDIQSGSDEVTARRVSEVDGDSFESQLCLPVSENASIDRVRTITITIENNTYYEAWERYLDDQFEDEVMAKSIDHSTNTVSYTVPLGQEVTPDEFTVDNVNVLGGIYMGSSSGEIRMTSPHAVIDSYNSSNGTYTDHALANRRNGDIFTRGDVFVQNGQIRGSAYTMGSVDLLGGGVKITGDLYFNNSTASSGFNTPTNDHQRDQRVGGRWDNGSYVPRLDDIDDQIDDMLDAGGVTNNNNGTSLIQDNETTLTAGGSGTLTSGVYYLESLDVPSNADLTLNTSRGDIVFVVEGNADISDGADITVVGDGQVRVFSGGTSGDQFDLGSNAAVTVENASGPTNRSDQFWFYCKSGCDAEFRADSSFTGVLYGPGDGGGQVNFGSSAQVYGALAADSIDMEHGANAAEFHFDNAVRNAVLDSDGDGVPDAADDNNSVADSDQDDVPDEYDDCENEVGDGVNGCLGVNEDEGRNALIVNQSRARLTVVGSMVADNVTQTREVGERAPLDVVFVIDDSGSMMWDTQIDSNWRNTRIVAGEKRYLADGTYTVPPGTTWIEQNYYGGYGWYTVEEHNTGDHVVIGDHYRDERVVVEPPTHVEVDDGEAWRVRNTANGAQRWFVEGQTFNRNRWNNVMRFEMDGNDPNGQRESAMQQFIGFLNESNGDRVGVVEFAGSGADVQHDISSRGDRFDDANTSLSMEYWGGTPMADAIETGADELESGTNDEKVMVLLTDGEPDDESDTRDAAENVDEDIQIHTVGLSGDTNEDLLQDIADETGGNYSHVGDSENLNETFRQIAGDVTEEEYNVIEYKNTTTRINVGGHVETLSGNVNDPENATRPSTIVDIADLNGADDDELEEYVGTLLSAQATTRSCDGVDSFETVTGPDGEEYERVTCNATTGVFDDVTNSSSNHEIYVDGEAVPAESEFDTGWFKDDSFREVINQYNGSLMADTNGDGVEDEFSIGENDAVIVVTTNSSDGDTDYVVLHFEAYDTTVEYDVNTSTNDDGTTFTGTTTDDDNSYVVDIDQSTIEVGNDSANIAVVPDRPASAAGSRGPLDGVRRLSTIAPVVAERARPAL